MCGILGIYAPDGKWDPEDARRRLESAAELLRHRGPDASGVSLWSGDFVAFAHRRLAILDLDPRANQPMVSADGALRITYNGEIYNFKELREELRAAGIRFRTESDTEVLLEGYRVWGISGLLQRLCGMFAFGLFDARTKRLFLVRDRAGKKPLFYSEGSGGLRFCSELRGLLRLSPEPKELDPEGLDAYLSLKFTPPPRTLIRGIRKVPPGYYLEKSGDGPARLERYWTPWSRGLRRPRSPEESIRGVDRALRTAMRRRLVSDVPICLFLSGGIDSSLIAAYLSQEGARGLAAYSVGYRDLPAYSEFEYSRLVAERFPIRYEEIVLDSRRALETLESDAAALDEPISDWIWVPLHHLSRRAHQDGFKVALVGEGSDEVFFGYDVMLKGLRDIRRFERPLWKTVARAGAPLLAPVYRVSRKGHRRYDLLRRAAAGEPVYMGSSVGFARSQRHQVAGPLLMPQGDPDAGAAFIAGLESDFRLTAPDPRDWANLISWIEFRAKMSEVLLPRVDRVSMSESIEARSPFLDHELVELAFSIPGDWKVPGGRLKGLLKEVAAQHLPRPIVSRKKMGFSFPFKEWLRGEFGGVVQETFRKSRLLKDGWLNAKFCRSLLEEHRSGWIDHAPRLWMLFDLCRWYDRWMA